MSKEKKSCFLIDCNKINKDTREVEATVSSENIVLQYSQEADMLFDEKLLHGAENIDLTRAKNGLGIFFNHNLNDLSFGVAHSIRIQNTTLKAILKFDTDQKSEEVWQKVLSGALRGVSIGYDILEARVIEGEKRPLKIVTRWQPYEVSLVSAEADPKSGIGRSKVNLKKEDNVPKDDSNNSSVDVEQITKQTQNNELQRIDDIYALGEQWGVRELATAAIKNKKSVDEFRIELLDKMQKDGRAKPITPQNAGIGMEHKDIQKYSFARALQAAMDNNWSNAGYELELSQAVAEKMGKRAKGFYVPHDVMAAKRDITTTSGGAIVPENYMASSFIDFLYKQSITSQLGVQQLTGLSGTVAIPKQAGTAQAYWLDEGEDLTQSELALGMITASMKTVGAMSGYTRAMLLNSNPTIENLVMMDLLKVIALEVDRVTIHGDGIKKPTGLLNTTGVNAIDSTGGMDFQKIISFKSKIKDKNADLNTLKWLTNTTVEGLLQGRQKVTNFPVYLWDDNTGKMNGLQTTVSNQVEGNTLILGDWSQIVNCFWGGLDVMVDPYTKASSGSVLVYGFQSMDTVVRYSQSFSASNNIA